jgi:DNA polymerase delta subunit 1
VITAISDVVIMPAKVKPNAKRALADSSKAVQNGVAAKAPQSPRSAKKRKLNNDAPSFSSSQAAPNGNKGKYGSSQPKSQFELEVLEKLTQDIHGLKQENSETDQKWQRPGLDDFDEKRDSLCFQQIECEEGTLHGGKATLKLFGVTEVGQRPSGIGFTC